MILPANPNDPETAAMRARFQDFLAFIDSLDDAKYQELYGDCEAELIAEGGD